jgi:hypothetical protein
MSSKNTWLWLTAAAVLFAFIFLFEHFRPHPPTGPFYLLPDLDAKTVRSVQIWPVAPGQSEIRVERTNHVWHLVAPVAYPAQGTNVDRLLMALQSLTVAHRIPERDFRRNAKMAADYGVEPPQLSLTLNSGPQILFGHRTSPGDQVFVRIPGIEGVAIVDSEVLDLFPSNVNAWRDVMLADTGDKPFDKIVVTNTVKSQWSFVLQRDATNRLWGMTFPLKVRADSEKVDNAVQQLEQLRVHDFIPDDPKPDLESLGLQPPALTVALGQGSNSVLVLDFGKELTNSPGLIYARRRDQTAVVTLSTNTLSQWNTSYDVFRDRHLLTMLGPIDSIHIIGRDTFTVQWQTNNSWTVLPQNFPADETIATRLARTLSELQVADFERDSVTATAPEWQQYGLKTPTLRFIISWAPSVTATNPPTQLDFGTSTNGQVFARRLDEDSVYGIARADYDALPSASWEMRDRNIWNFEVNDVVRLTIQQNGKTREIVHATNGWQLTVSTNWILNDSAIENTMRDLAHLRAFAWIDHGADKPATFGIDANSYQLTIELKNGQKLAFQLGKGTRLGSVYASVMLDGEPWIFEFPPDVLPSLEYSLTIPPN